MKEDKIMKIAGHILACMKKNSMKMRRMNGEFK